MYNSFNFLMDLMDRNFFFSNSRVIKSKFEEKKVKLDLLLSATCHGQHKIILE